MKSNLSLKAALELAAPHTWGASIVPCVIGAMVSIFCGNPFSPLLFFSVLLTAILLQSAVNTLNDYADFADGTDSADNCADVNDASIIYNDLKPKAALHFGIALIALAVIFGLYAIISAGWFTLVFGAIGVVVLLLYAFVLSALPVGEAMSGIVMGEVIALGMLFVLGGGRYGLAALTAVPSVVTIALIMLTNNTCDIEKDLLSGRKTLPGLLGRGKASMLYALLMALAVLVALVLIFAVFKEASFMAVILVGAILLPCYKIAQTGLKSENRVKAMTWVVSAHWRINLILAAAIAFHMILS